MLNLLKIVVLSSCITAFTAYAADSAALDKTNNRLTEISGVMQSINEELNSQRANIRSLKSRIDTDQKEDKAFRNTILRELRQLRRQNETLAYTLMKDKNKASSNNKEGTVSQSSKDTVTKRPVVSLNIKIGDYSAASEFTLTDRSKMQYALLIGRTFIQDIAVVDVSRQHIFERENNVLVLLNRDAYNVAKDKGINPNAEFDKQNINESAGKIAYPADNGSNLGDDAEKALPPVIDKRNAANQEKK